jgi:hypothetical protein
VARIDRVPSPAQIDFEPSAEIHRCGIDWQPDIAKMAGAIAGRNVHASAKRNRQMGKVAAHASLFSVAL